GGPAAGRSSAAADCMVLGIDDDDIVLMVAPDGLGRTPRGGDGRSTVAAVPPFTGTGERGHDPVGIHFSDAVALALADICIPLAVRADRAGAHDGGLRRGFSIPRPSLLTVTGEGRDDAGFQV